MAVMLILTLAERLKSSVVRVLVLKMVVNKCQNETTANFSYKLTFND